ncbi:polyamine aminopropyltransferase [Desulfallas sp. Bu1-1]|uniref:polyamine aminopropyltransferase n=1 Tax=Desulfallas sp. Bu1-1 TaxID=2787620 RepID=UPI0018A053FD|nr:polyamine aminopropyltransferase [Desulfallas sp. Bu1-1]MBF7082578.1 polyamine aminopropyltransferase [Desulfallas sp. Bu1-1]
MNFWLVEDQTEWYKLLWKIKETLHVEKTKYQHLAIVEMGCGRALILDGIVQTTTWDEFIYHEMLAHVALVTHPKPQKVLIIGGGDGGTAREVLKHKTVQSVDLVEIDQKVIGNSIKYLPNISDALTDEKVKIIIDDGIKYAQRTQERYDVILIDSPDPVGPAVGLYKHDFYQNISKLLNEKGILVAQTESPFFNQDLLKTSFSSLAILFPITRLYLACIPTYPSGLWSFTLASKYYDPLAVKLDNKISFETKYYNKDIHVSAFGLPTFILQMINNAVVV